jgi:hypothetical protein
MEDINKILTDIKNDYGFKILEDSQKFKAVFADYAKGEFIGEKELYAKVIEAGAAKEIKNSEDITATKNALVKRISEKYSLDEKLCVDCIEMLIFIIGTKKDNSVLNYKKGDKDILEYPNNFLNDVSKSLYPVTGQNITNAIIAKKILALSDNSTYYTLTEIIKHTDIKFVEAEKILLVLKYAGFTKEESGSNEEISYLFEINNNEKEIIALAEKKFPLTLEDIIKATNIGIEEIKIILNKLIKIGYFIKCGKKIISDEKKQIDTVFYYVFSEQESIESHLKDLLLSDDNMSLLSLLINNLPLSIDFESYLVSLLKENKTEFAYNLYEYSGLQKGKDGFLFSYGDIYIRKLGCIIHGNEQNWNKKIKKFKILDFILGFIFNLFYLGSLLAGIVLLMIFIDKHVFFIYFIICVICFAFSLIFLIFVVPKFYKKCKKYLNTFFEIPEQYKPYLKQKIAKKYFYKLIIDDTL